MGKPVFRSTNRRLMVLVLLVALLLWNVDRIRTARKAEYYRSRAAGVARMADYCREVVAMDPDTRKRKAVESYDDQYLLNPEWSREMIGFFEAVKKKYEQAALRPWDPLPPDPPQP